MLCFNRYNATTGDLVKKDIEESHPMRLELKPLLVTNKTDQFYISRVKEMDLTICIYITLQEI